jgi:hypothetical protein
MSTNSEKTETTLHGLWIVVPLERGLFLVRDSSDPEYPGFPVASNECDRLRSTADAKAFRALLHKLSTTPLAGKGRAGFYAGQAK